MVDLLPQPGRPETILIKAPSRLLAGHGFLAWAAFPDSGDDRARERALDALAHVTARLLPASERPQGLRYLPRDRAIDSALRPIQKRLKSARVAGWIAANLAWKRWLTDETWTRQTAHYASSRAAEMVPMAHTSGRDAQVRVWRQHAAMMHLCMPLALARLPADTQLSIAERFSELVPFLMPASFADLLTSDGWVLQALDVAERWRQALPLMCPDQAVLRDLPRISAAWL